MIKIKPYKHQEEFLTYMLKHEWIYCGDEMGLGKTIEAIMLILKTQYFANATIVVPAMLRDNWVDEIKKFTPFSVSKTSKRDSINVISYEAMTKNPELLHDREILVFDEAHYLKNPQSKRTKAAMKNILIDTKYVLLMSGTPVTNRVPDLWVPLKILSKKPGRLKPMEMNYHAFCRTFCHTMMMRVAGRTIMKHSGMKNKHLLKEYFEGRYLRRLAKNVLDLPKSTTRIVEAKLKAGEYDKELESAFDKAVKGLKGIPGATAKKKSALAKVPFTTDFVKNTLENEEACIVFSDHPEVLEKIKEKLDYKYRIGLISGQVNMNKRMPMVRAFQEGKLDLMLLSIPAASVGLTLTRSRICVFNDASWTPANNAQAEKRIDRIGQTRPVIHYYITGTKIDKEITTACIAKTKDAKEALGDN